MDIDVNKMETWPEICTVKVCAELTRFTTEPALRSYIQRNEEFRTRCSRKFSGKRYMLPREVIAYIKEQTETKEPQ